MHIREYQESDLAALREIHAAQGFEYALPDLHNPLFTTKLVLTQDAASLRNRRSVVTIQRNAVRKTAKARRHLEGSSAQPCCA